MFEHDSDSGLAATKSWLLTAFAAPSVLTVLAKVDDRLDLLPILERIILGFDSISAYFWNYVGDVIGLDLNDMHGVLTYYLICVGIMLRFSLGKSDFRSGSITQKIAESISMSIILVILSSSSQLDLISYIALTALFFLIYGYVLAKESRDRVSGNEVILIIMIPLLIIVLIYYFHYPNFDVAIVSALALIPAYSIRYIGSGNLYFSRVLVFCAGVFLVNFVGGTLVPIINLNLSRMGV